MQRRASHLCGRARTRSSRSALLRQRCRAPHRRALCCALRTAALQGSILAVHHMPARCSRRPQPPSPPRAFPPAAASISGTAPGVGAARMDARLPCQRVCQHDHICLTTLHPFFSREARKKMGRQSKRSAGWRAFTHFGEPGGGRAHRRRSRKPRTDGWCPIARVLCVQASAWSAAEADAPGHTF